jgi:hypothetical protein
MSPGLQPALHLAVTRSGTRLGCGASGVRVVEGSVLCLTSLLLQLSTPLFSTGGAHTTHGSAL